MFNMQRLTNTEKYLLKYIEEHLELIPSISIVKLSEEANVSTASIVRTMKKLGYDGFTSFKYDLKKQYQLSNKEFPTFNSLEIVDKKIQDVVDKNEQEVRKTIEQLDSKTIEDAMQAIFGARKVFIFSRGLSEMIASEMEIKFHLLERTCEQYVDPNIIKTISHRLNEQDLAIIVSLNGHTDELVEAAKVCHKNEVPIIVITANGVSPLAQLSDITFVGFKSEGSYFPEYEVRSRLPLQIISRILLDAYAIRVAYKRGKTKKVY